ncbi:MAG: hypothetical protein AAGC55_23270 [Myxococcota bacterium]
MPFPIDSQIYTLGFCLLILVVFAVAWRFLVRERRRLAALNNYITMKYRLGMEVSLKTVLKEVIADIERVEDASDRVRRQTGFDMMWKRAVRLESSVDFWVDLLQKLGLLGTVIGLGFALAVGGGEVGDLLGPLSMAVWTTVAGLLAGIAISWRFGRDMDVEVDVHEDHLKEWQAALDERPSLGRRGRPEPGRDDDPARARRQTEAAGWVGRSSDEAGQ